MPVVTMRTLPPTLRVKHAELVTGNVAISLDFFKRILASLRNIFGGRVKSFESLLDRARRKAIIRMKLKARAQGATLIYNLRLETASIVKSAGSIMGSVEVVAYGTAIIESTDSVKHDHIQKE